MGGSRRPRLRVLRSIGDAIIHACNDTCSWWSLAERLEHACLHATSCVNLQMAGVSCVRFFGGPAKPPSEAPTRTHQPIHHVRDASINPTPLARNNNNAHQNRNLLILRPCFLLCLALTVISFVLSEMAPTFLSRSNNQRIVPIEQCHE